MYMYIYIYIYIIYMYVCVYIYIYMLILHYSKSGVGNNSVRTLKLFKSRIPVGSEETCYIIGVVFDSYQDS